jgi:hypothetical protein
MASVGAICPLLLLLARREMVVGAAQRAGGRSCVKQASGPPQRVPPRGSRHAIDGVARAGSKVRMEERRRSYDL